MVTAEIYALVVLLLSVVAEAWHLRRSRRLTALAFGPEAHARSWTRVVPVLRCLALSALCWGLVNLAFLPSRSVRPSHLPEGGFRHLILLLDVSPSMRLKDAGPLRQQTRMQRANDIVNSLFQRIALDQIRISIVAFYNGAKPVVIDTFDLEVVRNILNDLPLDYAFDFGKTKIFDGLREVAVVAKSWQPASTTLLVVSDGDTVPDSGMPMMPPSIAQVLVVGVGDAQSGTFIDGHQSRQDAATLRQIAARLQGTYHDGNERHLPSDLLLALARLVPLADDASWGRRELSLIAVSIGSLVLVLLPLALAFAGSRWQPARRRSVPIGVISRWLFPSERA